VDVLFDNSKGLHILMICIDGFQFSYKSERYSDLIKAIECKHQIPWDGIRKQKCPVAIFDFAVENGNISNLTQADENLRDLLLLESVNCEEGAYEIRNRELIRKKQVDHVNDHLTFEEIHYYRKRLQEHNETPVILQAKLVRFWPQHVTFVSVKPYIKGVNTRPICNHINLFRKALKKRVPFNTLKIGQVYMIIGVCKFYGENMDRMGVRIINDLEIPPVFPHSDFHIITNDIFDRCLKFSIEKSAMRQQTHIKM